MKAIEFFAEKGSFDTTIADIAQRAKIAQGTVYVYFENKDDLLIQCLNEIIGEEINTIIKATEHIPDAMDRLFQFFYMHVELIKEKPYIARFLSLETRQSEEFCRKNPNFNPLKQYIDYVHHVASIAIEQGRIRQLDIEALSILIVGAMDLVFSQWLTHNKEIDIHRIANSIRDILKHGVNE